MTFELDRLFLYGDMEDHDRPNFGIQLLDAIFNYLFDIIEFADLMWGGCVVFILLILLTLVFCCWDSLFSVTLFVSKHNHSVLSVFLSTLYSLFCQIAGIRSSSDARNVYSMIESSVAMVVAQSLPGRIISSLISFYLPRSRSELTLVRISLTCLLYIFAVHGLYPWLCNQYLIAQTELEVIIYDIDYWYTEWFQGMNIPHLKAVVAIAVLIARVEISYRPSPPPADEANEPASGPAKPVPVPGKPESPQPTPASRAEITTYRNTIEKQKADLEAAKKFALDTWEKYDQKNNELIAVREDRGRVYEEFRNFRMRIIKSEGDLRHARRCWNLVEGNAKTQAMQLRKKIWDLESSLQKKTDEHTQAEGRFLTRIADLESKLKAAQRKTKTSTPKSKMTKSLSSTVPAKSLLGQTSLAVQAPVVSEMVKSLPVISAASVLSKPALETFTAPTVPLTTDTHTFPLNPLTIPSLEAQMAMMSLSEVPANVDDEVTVIQKETGDLVNKIGTLESKLESAQAAEKTLKSKVNSLEAELAKTPSTTSLQIENTELKARLAEQATANEDLGKKEAASEQARLEEQLELMEDLTAENAKMKVSLEFEHKRAQDALKQVDSLQAKFHDEPLAKAQLVEDLAKETEAKTKLAEELLEEQKAVAEMMSANGTLMGRVSEADQEKEALKAEKSQLALQIQEQYLAKDGLRHERDTLAQKLHSQSQQQEVLQTQVTNLQHHELELGEQELQKLGHQLDQATQQLNQANVNVERFERMCHEKDRIIENLNKTNHKVKDENVMLELAIQRLEQDVKDGERTAQELTHRIQDLELELELEQAAGPSEGVGQGLLAKAQPKNVDHKQLALQDMQEAYNKSLINQGEEAAALRRQLENNIVDLERKLRMATNDLTRSSGRADAARSAIREMTKRIEKLEAAAQNERDTPMAQASDPQEVDEIRHRLEEAKEDINTRDQQIAQAEQTINTLQERLKRQDHTGSIATALAKCQVELSEKTMMIDNLQS
ncbi:hypothetical protein BJY04DRAFT_212921 [Aspergillus karnatakaensis]|uniref:uncharacterized protein n=1 Tax=Aspergillus karnatakaensis TaxID=1810916 RepID=UPI003CCE0BF4